SEDDKIAAFHSADLYVAPNTGGESFGIVLLEAMASGAPVLASDIEAFAQVLQEGACGAMFRNGDPEDLARQAVAVFGNPAERDRLAAEGHRRALTFDWSNVARDVVRVYESVTVAGEKVQADLSGQAFGRLG
ncbi:MAG: glycosyltransferase family 4 protein, partial [Candidatus Nanopelagicales bacterium]|nr:glycosyltransferase family 4 protein [Candidatus Nanopelagicales bacterium]